MWILPSTGDPGARTALCRRDHVPGDSALASVTQPGLDLRKDLSGLHRQKRPQQSLRNSQKHLPLWRGRGGVLPTHVAYIYSIEARLQRCEKQLSEESKNKWLKTRIENEISASSFTLEVTQIKYDWVFFDAWLSCLSEYSTSLLSISLYGIFRKFWLDAFVGNPLNHQVVVVYRAPSLSLVITSSQYHLVTAMWEAVE